MKSKIPPRAVLSVIWLAAALVGAAFLSRYSIIAGASTSAPEHWPSAAPIQLDESRQTLILFAHPKCPCTRATVEELNRVLAQHQSGIAAHVFFMMPRSGSNIWSDTLLRRDVAALPGVSTGDDPDGEIAKLFGAETSGFVVMYTPEGKLVFSGGITQSRAHAGNNPNEEALIARLKAKKTQAAVTPVYGCSLFGNCGDVR